MSSSEPPRAPWIGALAPFFDDGVRARGAAYQRARAVSVAKGSGAHLAARVLGRGGIYQVDLRAEAKTLWARCDCPYFETEGFCKHIWAALLEGAARGALAHASGVEQLEPDYHYDDDDDDDFALPARSSSATPRAFTPPVRDWREAFADLRFVQQPRATRAELGYVAEVSSLGRLSISVVTRTANGRHRATSINWMVVEGLEDPAERAAIARLLGASARDRNGYAFGVSYSDASTFDVPAALQVDTLRDLAATGKLFVDHGSSEVELSPLAFREDGFELGVALSGGPPFTLHGHLERVGEDPIRLAPEMAADRVVLVRGEAAPLHGASAAWIRRLTAPISVLAPDVASLLTELTRLPALPKLALPASWEIAEVLETPVITVIFDPPPGANGARRIPVRVAFDYGDLRLFDGGARSAYDERARRLVARDLEREREGARTAIAAGLVDKRGALEVVVRDIPRVTSELLAAGIRVEASGKLYRKSGSFSLEVATGIDWFELSGAADFEGVTVDLPALLRAVKRGERTVLLGDGTVGLLPEAWLARVGLLASFADQVDGKVGRFRRSQALLLDALLAGEGEPPRCDAAFAALREELAGLDRLRPAAAPKAFRGKLRPYQGVGLAWLRMLRRVGLGGCLADDMGLGKTVQVLALLAERAREARAPALVVAPRSVVHNWVAEAARFTPKLRVLVHHGAARDKHLGAIEGHDLVITTYGTLRRDAPFLRETVFDTIVLDEAQNVKNAASDAAKAVRILRGEQRLALTGTPVENHLRELWSLFEFLNPGMLGRSSAFANASKGTDPHALTLLGKAIRPFLLRRTKSEVARDLPPRQEETLVCAMQTEQRALYDELKEHYRRSLLGRVKKSGLARSKIHVLEALLRLRQAACHPGLVDPKRVHESSAKLDVLLEQLDELREQGHKALVFSQFTSLLAIVRARLDARGQSYAYLDGKTRDREHVVSTFQTEPGCGVFLLSLKAGGVGLNLTAAEYVFLLDPWWNPAVEAQAIDRAHRIGQTRPVFAYRLVAEDTIEQKIAELQDRKRKLAAAIVRDDDSLLEGLSVEDLELLLA